MSEKSWSSGSGSLQVMPERGKSLAVVPLDVVTPPTVGHSAHEDRLPGAVVVERIFPRRSAVAPGVGHQVEDGRGKVPDLPALLTSDVPGHGESLQVHLGSRDGTP